MLLGSMEAIQKNRPVIQEQYGKPVWDILHDALNNIWTGKEEYSNEKIQELIKMAVDARELRANKVA